MKGQSNVVVIIIIVIITISTVSLVFLYYQSVIGKATTELEERGPMNNCYQSANIEITDFDGENMTIRNNGGASLNISSFNISSLGNNYEYTFSDADGILKLREKVVLNIAGSIGPGVLKVTGECEVRDAIDTRYLNGP